MDSFHQSLEAWQLFYATIAAASATLTGLLFVSLSLNRERLKGERAKTVIATARRTFGDFLYVLMIAIIFIVPHQVPYSLTIALLVLGITRGIGLIREARQHMRKPSGRINAPIILRVISLPFIATLGLILVAIAVAFGFTISIYGLVIVIAALLVTACWNAWLLLIEE
jgi:hypothetical protein